MCDGHLLLPYYSEITSGVDPIHILHPWSEGLFIREAVPDPLNYSLDTRGNVVALMRILLFKSSIYKNTQALQS